MDIDVEALLAPLDADAPCGDDLEYDPDFIEMITLATPKGDQQVGDSVIEAEEVDHAEVAKLALGLLARTKDLRVAVQLAESVLHTDGYPAFARVLDYIAQASDTYWDTIYPELDADDDNDPTMRVNAVRGLNGSDTVLRALRRAPLTLSRGLGRFSLRDIMVAQGEMSAPADMDRIPQMAEITGAFQDSDPESMTAIREAVIAARKHVKAISAAFDGRIGSDGPDLSDLDKALHAAQQAMARALGAAAGADNDDDESPQDEGGAQGGPVTRSGGGGPIGGISGPEDVTRALDRICEYYARHEPSSPVPLLLQRARRMVGADFMSIIKDMASEGVEQVSKIGGIRIDDDY